MPVSSLAFSQLRRAFREPETSATGNRWAAHRGLGATDGVLFVLDGGKALARVVRDVFGELAVIARCRVHKERNVPDHLPEAERPWVRRKWRAAWTNPDAGEAEAALRAVRQPA